MQRRGLLIPSRQVQTSLWPVISITYHHMELITMNYIEKEAKRIGLEHALEGADDPALQARSRKLRTENMRRVEDAAWKHGVSTS